MPNNFILVVRLGVFALSCLLSLPVIALCVHTGILAIWYEDGFYFFQRFGVAAAGLTLLMCIIFGITGLVSKNAWISWNVVEVPIIVGISAIWLAQAIIMDEWIAFFRVNWRYDNFRCLVDDPYPSLASAACPEFPPISGISYTIFALLMAYCILTIILCIVGKVKSHDHKVWLVQAYYAEYFGKEPPRPVFQPAPQYLYYGDPNQFQQQAGTPGVPPMVYVPQGQEQTGVPMMMHNGPPGIHTSESPSPPLDQKV
ncbi:hypothetical protein E1B28_010692 [Marasmius oreades]|uniref:MARVEL domain-containing protein n=1 Tax=Marasmius oreades TaxID=181124 RepID=A0A9P7RY92_9AGAR|nr:uncharacterized protein E1B28_010692 [Marasmius oreades]KAG7091673.1 hypothetical protein E1B28_010692 [Marasmius oreades]